MTSGDIEEARGLQDVERAAHVRAESAGGACLAGGAEDGRGVVDAVHLDIVAPRRGHEPTRRRRRRRARPVRRGPPHRAAARLGAAKSTTSSPSARSCRARWIPTSPVPPVIRFRLTGRTPASFTRATARTHAPPARWTLTGKAQTRKPTCGRRVEVRQPLEDAHAVFPRGPMPLHVRVPVPALGADPRAASRRDDPRCRRRCRRRGYPAAPSQAVASAVTPGFIRSHPGSP